MPKLLSSKGNLHVYDILVFEFFFQFPKWTTYYSFFVNFHWFLTQGTLQYGSVSREGSSLSVPTTYVSQDPRVNGSSFFHFFIPWLHIIPAFCLLMVPNGICFLRTMCSHVNVSVQCAVPLLKNVCCFIIFCHFQMDCISEKANSLLRSIWHIFAEKTILKCQENKYLTVARNGTLCEECEARVWVIEADVQHQSHD